MPAATAGVERLDRGRDRDRRDRVAVSRGPGGTGPCPPSRRRARAGRSRTAGRRSAVSPPPSSPTTKQPACCSPRASRARFVARATGTRAAAPAETFHADAVTPAARRSGTSTPCAPNAPADRSTAPRLRGSVTPSSATTSGAVAGLGRGVEQVVGVGVVVRRHLDRDALVHGAVGEPVELGLGRPRAAGSRGP